MAFLSDNKMAYNIRHLFAGTVYIVRKEILLHTVYNDTQKHLESKQYMLVRYQKA